MSEWSEGRGLPCGSLDGWDRQWDARADQPVAVDSMERENHLKQGKQTDCCGEIEREKKMERMIIELRQVIVKIN